MTRMILAAAAALLSACAASAAPAERSNPPVAMAPAAPRIAAIDCDVRATSSRDGTRIEAVVYADRRVSGSYELVISKAGRAGSSDIVQGGPFDAAAGARVVLSSAEIGADRHARMRATLRLDEAGREVCRRSLTL